jgi:hypothetical protein
MFMIRELKKLRVVLWECDQCGNRMLSELRPSRCTRDNCRKSAIYIPGVSKRGRPKKEGIAATQETTTPETVEVIIPPRHVYSL